MDSMIGMIGGLVYLAFIVVTFAGFWKTFEKAGQPGWACLVPFYNIYIMMKIAQKPTWWILLFFVPIANIIVMFKMAIATAKLFGKGTGFGIGLVFLGFIFYPILGFGDAVYDGKSTKEDDSILDSSFIVD